jgi:hypothetical protein
MMANLNLNECEAFFLDHGKVDEDAESSDSESIMIDVENQMSFMYGGQGQSIFVGKSSSVGLFRTILGMKYEQSGAEDLKRKERVYFESLFERRSQFWPTHPVRSMPCCDSVSMC